MRTSSLVTLAACALLVGAAVSGCSSTDSSTSSGSSPAASSAAPQDAGAMCASIVTDGLTLEAATAAAEAAGYTTRVGSIDGEPQAVTTDFLENRLTFDTQDGIVTGCLQG
jgi:hypothetical protein